MKKLITILTTILFSAGVFAQVPQKMSYQAVVRNTSGGLVQNTVIGMRISILHGSETGMTVYNENLIASTNANGLVSVEIGGGAGFDAINWSDGPYFIKTETDPTGGTNYTITGVSKLLSVPYALRAKTAENGFSGNYNDLTNKPVLFDGHYSSLTGLPLLFDGNYNSLVNKPIMAPVAFSGSYNDLINKPAAFDGTWNSLTGKPTTISGYGITDALTTTHPAAGISAADISNWTSAFNWGAHSGLYKPVSYIPDWNELTGNPFSISTPSDNQLLKYNSSTGKWQNWAPDFLTTETDGSVTNEIQVMTINDDIISLENGGTVRLPDIVKDVKILNDSLFITFSYGQVINAGYIGNGKPGSSLPVVTTTDVSEIGYYGTVVNGNITNTGNEFILTRGACLSVNSAPDLNDTVFFGGSGPGIFSTSISQLLPGKTYHVRAFATNTVGTSYGHELSFTTKVLTVPSVTSTGISNITNTTAIAGGELADDGGTPVLERGICWSLNPDPLISDNYADAGSGSGSFLALLSGLTSNTTYHVRAYAANATGAAYGEDITFTTITYPLASVTTAAVSSVSYTTAISGGNVTSDNGSSITSRGICWATNPLPTAADSKYTEPGGTGSFIANLSGLIGGTTYYVRAFAINGGGTSYGNQVSFTTLTSSAPSLTTKAISGISSNLAGSGGVIVSDGGSPVTAKGVVWSINTNPTLSGSFTSNGTGPASYNSTMEGLTPLTTYHVRAYATNSLGTAYGNELSFTTTDLITQGPTVPVIGTSASAISGSSTGTSGGYVSSDGGSPVTARGVCWSTSVNPTLDNSFSTDGTGLGYFTSTVAGLSGCGTIYYIRAYATNSTGTGYGNQNTISTGLLPVITTNDVTGIADYSAVSGGVITNDGGCPVTQKGICWSYNPNPTLSNYKTTEGAGSTAFVSNMTGLYGNRTYYVRAYTTNSVGTTYGPEKVFITTTPASPYIGQNYAGGIVFYIDGTGQHGLVVSPANTGQGVWGCHGTSVQGTSTALGTGAANTAAIVATCPTAGIPARLCDDLVLNGYSDWFLPSRDELALIYNNLHAQGIGGFTTYFNWSSSEASATTAWFINFSGGAILSDAYGAGKSLNNYFRAVRAF